MNHRVTGYIAFDVPADDCASVKITMEAAVKDLGGRVTGHSYTRDDYDAEAWQDEQDAKADRWGL